MTSWQPIERCVFDKPIWILKYNMYSYPKGHPMEGNFCNRDEPNAQKFTDCHGWYESEEDAIKALRHFPKYSDNDGYRLEKVYKRELL